MIDKAKRYDKIKGAIYGVAVGDCLGAPAEFRDQAEIQSKFGQIRDIVGGSLIGAAAGCGTDDTAMTLALADGLMKCGPEDDPIVKVGAEFVRWYNGTPIGLGGTCGRSIEIASHCGRIKEPSHNAWMEAAKKTDELLDGRSGGNGTLMRTIPVALFYPKESLRNALADDLSAMTHFDPDAGIACMLYCEIVSKLIQGYGVPDAVSCLKSTHDYGQMVTDPRPTGYVKDSFKTALWGWLNENTFENALIAVVNLGGDADTTGAICGGLAGANHGYSAIPDRWIKALHPYLKSRLDAVAEAAARVWEKV